MSEFQRTHTIHTGIPEKPNIDIELHWMPSPRDLEDLIEVINLQKDDIRRLKGDCRAYQEMLGNNTDRLDAIKKDLRAWMQNKKGMRLQGLEEAMKIVENHCR